MHHYSLLFFVSTRTIQIYWRNYVSPDISSIGLNNIISKHNVGMDAETWIQSDKTTQILHNMKKIIKPTITIFSSWSLCCASSFNIVRFSFAINVVNNLICATVMFFRKHIKLYKIKGIRLPVFLKLNLEHFKI